MNLIEELDEIRVAFNYIVRKAYHFDTLCLPAIGSVPSSEAERYLGMLTDVRTCTDGFGFRDGGKEVAMLFHPAFARKFLLVLPCNPGALYGDYFRGNFWGMARRMLGIEMRSLVDICAVDSIKTFIDPDALGPLVHEREMWRVEGFDFHPNESVNPAHPPNWKRLHMLADSLKPAVERILPHYSFVFALIPVRGYRVAFTAAVKETVGFDRVYIEDQPSATFRRREGLERVVSYIKAGNFPAGVFHTFPHAGRYSPEWKEQMVYRWRKHPRLPVRFRYWTWPEFFIGGK